MDRESTQTGIRFALMAMGMVALLSGLWAGLLRLGWAGPILQTNLPMAHGPLMVCGFLGTLISLERTVALDRAWAYVVPALVGVGGMVLLSGQLGMIGPLLILLGSAGLVVLFGVVLSIQASGFAFVMAGGAVAWAVGNGLWLAGWPISDLVPWWMGFLVLTIAGERLELSRMLFYAEYVEKVFFGIVGGLGIGMVATLSWPDIGLRTVGLMLIALAAWLAIYDIARRTVRGRGLTRFIAVCLLTGYAWLAVGGALMMVYGNPGAGPVYDIAFHAVFVGFVFSMIFGHAPIIFPSVLGVSIPYRPLFYGHVVLLHVALTLRAAGDLTLHLPLRAWGGWGNAAAIVLFLDVTVYSVIRGDEHPIGGGPMPSLDLNETSTERQSDEIPDLDLSATTR
ncbi:hypothetical protein [Longibacter salinarum]|uniref:hypothetical protein n=1 Tax=Longibacter salinarum TaxID=1850348 RepID=UPI001C54F500|nr:hypothetical protein [Longibacter salinarum]